MIKFKTSLKQTPQNAVNIEIELPQIPSVHIHGKSISTITIQDSIYEVRYILYRHNGGIEVIVNCTVPNQKGVHSNMVLLEGGIDEENLVRFYLKTNTDGNVELKLAKLPQYENEYVEYDDKVYFVSSLSMNENGYSSGLAVKANGLSYFRDLFGMV